MRLIPIILAFALVGCGGGSNPPAPPLPPPPPPVFSGAIAPGAFIVTAASAGVSMTNGTLAFPQCATVGAVQDAPACWISYATALLAISAHVGELYTLAYTVIGSNPVFIHDSPNNTPNGPVTVRLLLTSAGYRMFSNAQPLAVGPSSLAVSLNAGNWILVDAGGNTVVDEALFNAELGHLTGVGFCFGGGFFACHGIAVSSGSATFTVDAASIQ